MSAPTLFQYISLSHPYIPLHVSLAWALLVKRGRVNVLMSVYTLEHTSSTMYIYEPSLQVIDNHVSSHCYGLSLATSMTFESLLAFNGEVAPFQFRDDVVTMAVS